MGETGHTTTTRTTLMLSPPSPDDLTPDDLTSVVREYCAAREIQRVMAEVVLSLIDEWMVPVIRKTIWAEQDRDDVYQEAVAKILANLEKYQPDRPLKPWVQVVTKNVAYDFLRRRRRDLTLLGDGADAISWQDLGGDRIYDRIAAESGLTTEQNAVFQLGYRAGESDWEIALFNVVYARLITAWIAGYWQKAVAELTAALPQKQFEIASLTDAFGHLLYSTQTNESESFEALAEYLSAEHQELPHSFSWRQTLLSGVAIEGVPPEGKRSPSEDIKRPVWREYRRVRKLRDAAVQGVEQWLLQV